MKRMVRPERLTMWIIGKTEIVVRSAGSSNKASRRGAGGGWLGSGGSRVIDCDDLALAVCYIFRSDAHVI